MAAFLLQQLLSDSAARDPEHTAVVFGSQSMRYGELEALTDRLAGLLRANGVQRGDRVGILLHKSAESIASIFAILKAGGVYVPLDPNAPARRLAVIARDCGIRVLLAGGDKVATVVEMAGEGAGIQTVVAMNGSGPADHAPPFAVRTVEDATGLTRPAEDGTESDLAYILYTSGSTGQPKGVMISHRNALTFVDWAVDAFSVTPDDVLSNHAPLHFDLSIFDVFASAHAGATVAPVPEGMSIFPVRLSEWMERHRITIWYSVPSILTMLVMHGALAKRTFEDLRTVLFAGEVFPVKYLRELMSLVPRPEYFNLYGPTETNVITYCKVDRLDPDRVEPISIGVQCANMGAFALDSEGRLVTGEGVEGELYGRGPSVALGYWGQIEKTAELFVQNPLNSLYPDRTYRTGDIVTLGPDGSFVYRGRRDHMVKSRGYRIELGDIEAAIYSHRSIKEAAVVAVPDDMIGHSLHAFIVQEADSSVAPDEVLRHCRDRLPGYMVPGRISTRTMLPKTSNGKIDRVTLTREAIGNTVPTGT